MIYKAGLCAAKYQRLLYNLWHLNVLLIQGSNSFGRKKIQEFTSPILEFSWCYRS